MKPLLSLSFLYLAGLTHFHADKATALISKTFYNLPVNLSRDRIIQQITSDNRFAGRPLDFMEQVTRSYSGNILRPNVPAAYQVDSATIAVSWSYGGWARPNSSRMQERTTVTLTYYTPDSASSHVLASFLWKSHRLLARDSSDFETEGTDNHLRSYGREALLGTGKKAPILRIEQPRNGPGHFVVFEYDRPGA